MKKLIFRKVAFDTTYLFVGFCLSLGVIVWTLQAVNYLDFVTQDGHGFKTYLLYSLYNFPKIIHRIIPFVFFISLFLIFTNYEKKNELLIFWTHGISKINFANRILFLSIILLIFQIFIGSYVSPMYQLKSRVVLKNSNVNFFSSLIKEGKFINAVSGLTIFIQKQKNDGSFENVFIDDSSLKTNKITYASNGRIIDIGNKKVFKLFKGSVINKKQNKINEFKFDQINIDLSKYSSNTILVPKIQETSTQQLINCFAIKTLNNKQRDTRNCDLSINQEIKEELLKRLYKPIYIPLIALVCCFLIILPKSSNGYHLQKKITFLIGFIILVLSETSLRYSSSSFVSTIIYIIIPLFAFVIIYSLFLIKSKDA